eukprot:CAMPEP_0204586396 /NCGR_PEP_ID=MMETSP0661-20131031/47466_1 /ASSEMBLY_ACC=CAM_ASM_000606 /TAXON_ID=109239 /ORGANISM="Alexandrium margalefi, Strain AMGDE01CS-322" /LENGTH=40 /DNA_ID= /DNA_START= /DNA_END= /DNA_ORIENTATION=
MPPTGSGCHMAAVQRGSCHNVHEKEQEVPRGCASKALDGG